MFFQFFSAISEVIVSETQYILSEWLHTAYQMVFNQKYSNFKIRSIFGVYLENSPVNTFDQPHGSDQCGYIHLLHGSDLMETVVRVGNLCRLGCLLTFTWHIPGCYHRGRGSWCGMRWLGRLEQGNCTPGRPVLRLNILRSKDTDSASRPRHTRVTRAWRPGTAPPSSSETQKTPRTSWFHINIHVDYTVQQESLSLPLHQPPAVVLYCHSAFWCSKE